MTIFLHKLHSFKYFYQIIIIFKHIYFLDRILTGITTLCQSGLGSNSNKGILHTSQSPTTGISPLDAS